MAAGQSEDAPVKKHRTQAWVKAYKALCPEALCAAVIGHGGGNKNQLEEASGAKICFSNREVYYPGTKLRVLAAYGETTEQLMTVFEAVVAHTVDMVAQEHETGRPNWRGPSEELVGKEPGEYIFRMAAPRSCTGAIIGTKGSTVQSIREKTGVKVFLDADFYEGHQLVRMIGKPEALNMAIPEICGIIDDGMTEEAMADWGAQLVFDGSGGKGGSKGKNKGKEDHGKGAKGRPRSRSPRGHWEPAPSNGAGAWDEQSWEDGSGWQAAPAQSIDVINGISSEFDPQRIAMAHSICCDLPPHCLPALVGRGQKNIKMVEEVTGAKVILEKEANQAGMQTMHFQGPLLAVYAAHLMMMKRYHEEEVRREQISNEAAKTAHTASLEAQIANLRAQLQEAKGEAPTKGKGGAKGKR